MIHRSAMRFLLAVLLIIPTMAFAQIGNVSGGGDSISWDITASGHDRVELRITGPGDVVYTKSFNGNGRFSLRDLPGDDVEDGTYQWEMRLVPKIPAGIAKKLDAARAAGDDKAVTKILKDAGIASNVAQSGAFTVSGGSIVTLGQTEGGSAARSVSTDAAAGSKIGGITRRLDPVVQDTVIPDDLIVTGSACIGFDCVDGESFGFDTIRMKENNLRIKAEDTSASTGFPTTDWQLTFNDSTSGGANKFSVDDVTAVTTPLTITGAAPTNSVFVDSSGRVGFRTGTPVLDLHVNTGNTPALRLEQTNAGGFTAQTWDVAGNEANFFVRDVTGGSRLSFRIRPGAPTSSIDIAASGKVGMGTASPQSNLDVRGANAHVLAGNNATDFIGLAQTGYGASNGTEHMFLAVQTGLTFLGSVSNTNLAFLTNNTVRMTLDTTGRLGIGTASPTAQLHIANGASFSTINAGATQFTASSSRTFKDNIKPVEASNILAKIEAVPVVTYDFKNDGPKDRMGLIAEDFHKVFDRGDEKMIDGHEVQMALWLAVQELTAENKALVERLNNLEKQVAPEQQQ